MLSTLISVSAPAASAFARVRQRPLVLVREAVLAHHPLEAGLAHALPSLRRPADDIAADRKSTRLNSSHANISYAVFCLKKKKQTSTYHHPSSPITSLPTLS